MGEKRKTSVHGRAYLVHLRSADDITVTLCGRKAETVNCAGDQNGSDQPTDGICRLCLKKRNQPTK